MSQVYVIGGTGLQAIGGEPICIYSGAQYHYGYSSSPDPIWVESVGTDYVTFYRYPYGDKNRQREQPHLFRNIVQKGTATRLRDLQRYAKCAGDNPPEWLGSLIRHYIAVLAGKRGLEWSRDDIRMVKVEFAYTGRGDGWSEFERHYPHSVSGSMTRPDGSMLLESYDFSAASAAQLCHDMNCGKLPNFEYLGSSERD